MNSKNMVIIGIVIVLVLSTPTLVYSDNEGVTSANVSDPNNPRLVDSFGPIEAQKQVDTFLKTEVSQQEREIIEYFEKTKSEILQGRKFNDQSTAANALLTLISAYHHQGQNTLEQILPIVKQKQFEKLSSPETQSKMLDFARKSIVCRIKIENRSPEESDICAIYTSASPDKKIDQVMSFGYVEGAWRFVGGTSEIRNWSTQAKQVEALTRNILQLQQETRESDGEIVQASERQLQDRNKLLAWWRLDEADSNNVADSSGNACTGMLVGNPQWRPAGGKVGGALEFDGDGDYVEIGNESAFDIVGAITVAAWVKVSSFDKRWQSIVTKGDTAWRIQRTADKDTLAFHCTGITSVEGQWPQGIEGKKSVNDGRWHHVVGVYNGATVSLYIDGVLDTSSEAYDSIRTNDSTVTIGGNSERSDREWNGLIDEVCIIAGAIDANAVNALYTGADPIMIAQTANPQLQSPDKLLAWWKFDDDANDSAGANHGTIHGNPTYVDGKVGRAISFDGDDYVDCGNADSLNFGTGDWIISAWIKTTQSGTEPENRGTVFANGGDEEGGIRYALAVNEEYLGKVVLTTDTDTQKVQAIGKTAMNDDTWHHVVGTRSEGQLRVYVDGVLDGGSYLPAEYDLSGASQHNAYIGVITDNKDNSLFKHFVGLIDEVCIIRGAIDADGIRALYSGEDPATVAKTAVITRPARAAAEQVDAVPSEAAPASQEQFQDRVSGTSNVATALILVLVLAGVIGAIVLFVVKSSIR